ncbi:MAG: GNAT family N-acetyltransferase [Ruminococcaceae bacterium]|nr:GNAT family N-acetyltransferase [Oscillospiraceae bacterium]
MKLPIIETERLILRPLEVSDAEHIFNTWASDPRVTKFMTYTTHKSSETTKEWLESVERDAQDNDSKKHEIGFQLKESGKLIGSGGAYYKPEFDRWSIGYNLAFDYWHQGYTSEAMKGLVDTLSKMGIKHFISDHAVDNPNSGKVMEKIGMKFDHMGSYTCFDGRVFEAKYYIMDLE